MSNLIEVESSKETEADSESRSPVLDTQVSPYSKFQPYLSQILRERIPSGIRSKVNPSDLIQDAFFVLHKSGVNLEGKNEKWLFRLLRRTICQRLSNAIRHFEQSGRMPSNPEYSFEAMIEAGDLGDDAFQDSAEKPSEISMLLERAEAVRAALKKHPLLEQAILTHWMFDQMGFDEIAKKLGIGKFKVRSIHGKAMKKLRVELREFDPRRPT